MAAFTLGTILKAALVAGIAAALTVAVFHQLVTEPLMDRAISLEEERQEAGAEHEPPIVTRDAQRVGLVVGFLLYGLVWSSLIGIAYHAAQQWLPSVGTRRQRLLLTLAAYWAVALFPFLKYPANPPGVGDPGTIGYRQALYLGVLALSIAGTGLAIALSRRSGRSGPRQWAPSLAFLAVFSLTLYVVLPGNPDPVRMPLEIVTPFRVLSLVGLTLFWAVLGILFAMLLKVRPTPGVTRSIAS